MGRTYKQCKETFSNPVWLTVLSIFHTPHRWHCMVLIKANHKERNYWAKENKRNTKNSQTKFAFQTFYNHRISRLYASTFLLRSTLFGPFFLLFPPEHYICREIGKTTFSNVKFPWEPARTYFSSLLTRSFVKKPETLAAVSKKKAEEEVEGVFKCK